MGLGPWPLVSSGAPSYSQNAPARGEGRACQPKASPGSPQPLCPLCPGLGDPGPRGRPASEGTGLGGEASPGLTMFLYWKKRGTYELEALPSALAALELGGGERFSWSSTLDIIEDLGGRCGPFPGGLSGGSHTWSIRRPPFGQRLWRGHHVLATVKSLGRQWCGGRSRP